MINCTAALRHLLNIIIEKYGSAVIPAEHTPNYLMYVSYDLIIHVATVKPGLCRITNCRSIYKIQIVTAIVLRSHPALTVLLDGTLLFKLGKHICARL